VLTKAIYFFIFAAIASFFPYLVLHYKQLGLSGKQIGILTSLFPIVTVFAAPIWGTIADRTQRHKTLLLLMLSGAITSVFLLKQVTAYGLILLLIITFAISVASIGSIIDSSVLTTLGTRKQDYGKFRLWGTIGFGVISPIAGIITQGYGLSWAFYMYVTLLSTVLILVLNYPIQKSSFRKPLGSSNYEFRNPAWTKFLLIIFVIGIGLGISGNYLLLRMESLGIARTYMGLTLVSLTLSEVPLMLFGHRLLKIWPAHRWLFVALFVMCFRLLCNSWAVEPWHFLVVQFLHGPTFALVWVAGVAYADELAPPHLKATSQGLFNSTVNGLGGAVGALIGGFMLDAFGAVKMFSYASLGLSLAAVMVLFFTRKLARR
jgi:MFS transporter, PPP family, 3-phenylpropionic acid transporter